MLRISLSDEALDAIADKIARKVTDALREQEFLTAEEAARLLRISMSQLYRNKERYGYTHATAGEKGRLLFRRSEIMRMAGAAEKQTDGQG